MVFYILSLMLFDEIGVEEQIHPFISKDVQATFTHLASQIFINLLLETNFQEFN